MEKPKKYFRVLNDPDSSGKDIYITWSESLLSDPDLTKWLEYKATEFEGKTEQEVYELKRMPVAERLKRWATINRIGIEYQSEMFKKGVIKDIPRNFNPEYMFHLPLGETIINDRQYEALKRFEKKAIKQKLEPGQTKNVIHYEGFLTFKEIDKEEVEKLNKKKEMPTEADIEKVIEKVKK